MDRELEVTIFFFVWITKLFKDEKYQFVYLILFKNSHCLCSNIVFVADFNDLHESL